MHTIMRHDIPILFSAYSTELGEGWNESSGKAQRVVRRTQYWCRNCRTGFTVDHNYHGMTGNYDGYNDHLVYCPHCGERHEAWWNGPRYIYVFRKRKEGLWPEAAPLSVSMRVMEGNDIIVLKARFRTIQFLLIPENQERHAVALGERREEFRFNVRQRTADFTLRMGQGNAITAQYSLGSPFDDHIFVDSLLTEVSSENRSEDAKPGTLAVMRSIRDRIRAKWKKIHGYDIGSVFVSHGRYYGRMLFPLLNIAYRLAYPDTPNLPKKLNGTLYHRQDAMYAWCLSRDSVQKFGDLETIRKGKGSVPAVIGLFGLPDKPVVRRILESDIFAAAELSEAFRITDNVDYAMGFWRLMQERSRGNDGTGRQRNWWSSCSRQPDTLTVYGLLQELGRHHSARSVLAFARRSEWHCLIDTSRMLALLEDERKELLWRERVKLKDLHDWLIQATKHQRSEGVALKVPEHVRNRLTMQLDQLKFFLPEHSKELMEIGDQMHNCVRTYDESMRLGKSYIVPVTDDNGKLVACLEVRGNALVQAKLKRNEPVRKDKKLCAAVLDWCRKTGLSIGTADVPEDSGTEAAMEREAV